MLKYLMLATMLLVGQANAHAGMGEMIPTMECLAPADTAMVLKKAYDLTLIASITGKELVSGELDDYYKARGITIYQVDVYVSKDEKSTYYAIFAKSESGQVCIIDFNPTEHYFTNQSFGE